VYAGVSKLPAATYLVNDGGRIRLERYWHPRFDRPATQDMDALSREVVAALGRAVVASDIEPAERTGSFLSGGLDSSTVTGLLAVSARQASPAFSVGFGVEEFNELAYARIASQRFHCPHFEYQVTAGDVVEIVPRIAAAYDEPFGNSSALPTFCCARLAKEHGVDHLLAGDGGDELFGGNERYVRQKVFEHYTRLPGWSRKFLLQPLADRLDPETSPFPLRKLSSYVRQARVPLPERYESWNMIYREGSAEVFDPDLVATVDTSYHLRKMREAWDECPSDDLLDRMLWYDWKFTLADNDLRKVTRMCELAGVRVSFPMLDEDVVDLSLRVPSHAKIEGNDLRSFFKKAVRELLPREIIDKKKHGFGLPFGVWLKEHGPLQELVYDSLNALKSRHLLNRNFIERVASEHRQGHASYYGYAIWDLMMLEQWFQQRAPGLGERAKPERTAPGAPRQASTNGAPLPS
jgi:asparagine synthase (glutamine-hydrolysing)